MLFLAHLAVSARRACVVYRVTHACRGKVQHVLFSFLNMDTSMASTIMQDDECTCVDTSHVAVAPAELVGTQLDQGESEQGQSAMSQEVLKSHQPRITCLPNPGDYRLLNFIGPGFGGLSKVFVARHSPSKTLVVIKQTNVDVKNAEQLEELKYEVQVLRSLSHPNILPFYCSFVTQQEVWHVLPLMQFGSCADMLKSSYPDGMNEILVAAILWELLQGLEYLHKMGIIHRAVKGSHILVGADGMVCLSGLRKSIMLPQKRDKPQIAHHFPSHAVAVLPWMAPEILQQDLRGYDFKSDIYSVGITAIQLGRGTVPYVGMPPTKVLLEKLRGDTPKLCDSLVMNDVDTSAPGASDSGVGSSVTSPGEWRNGGQPTPQGKFSVAFQQVKRKAREVLAELMSAVPSLANRSEDKRIDQDIASSIASEGLSAMNLDEWSF
ncbi:STE20-related kinase adapter protein alpha-like isoform X2 [Porites lutea]|uniref:STE20-related kinase adapter protein alpha-like isoform X2 n=1 Tax=Porites lutea TaxID=51062 RepID=UPI003CC55F44